MKEKLKVIAPQWLVQLRRRLIIAGLRRRYRNLSRSEVFSRIYRDKLWGEDPQSLYFSGSGSVGKAAKAYQDFVCDFILQHNVRSVVDLGCGDFRVAAPIPRIVDRYIGVDIVRDLVDELRRSFGAPKVQFMCLDIVTDDLPSGELCLVRQVLQHLSSDEIVRVLKKLNRYPYVLITEHYPADNRRIVPNKDKPHGPDTRVVDNSAVFLDKPPFNMGPVKEVLRVEAGVQPGETIRTFLVVNQSLLSQATLEGS